MRLVTVGLCLLAVSCSAPSHENPFDPSTPPALQARATLAGQVTLEPRGATAPSPAGVDVSVPGVGSVTTDASGAWSLPRVPTGTHTVLFRRAGWNDLTVPGVVVTLDDGDGTVTVPTVRLALSRGNVAGAVALSAGTATGFPVGSDLSGTVVTLEAPGEPARTTVTDATGAYRFEGVPASLPGTSYVLTARRPFFLPASGTVAAVADESATAPALSVAVAVAALSGHAVATNVAGGGDALLSDGITVSLSGTAFNGAPWATAAVTGVGGAWTSGALPPGTYDVVAAVAGRSCEAYPRTAVEGGAAADAGSVLCLDAVAPAALALGAPAAPAGGQAGYTASTTIWVPITAQAIDATVPSNLVGYETAVGASADFTGAPLTAGTPAGLAFAGLASNARNVLWARPVDSAGNAGVPVAVEVIHDGLAPPTPTLSTPRAIVAATTTSVTLTGSESDANFHHYETCTTTLAPLGASCAPAPTCTFAASPASAAVSLAANQRTCLYARAVDAAGNVSGVAQLDVVSDLTPPLAPVVAPVFDPTKLTVRADYVDFFVSAPATADPPAGTSGWDKIAWLEVDSGAGFQPLCPSPACRASDRWDPCGACGCADARLLCRGTTFVGVRMPLLGGLANQLNVRALDVAGNYGPGVGQKVVTAGLEGFVAATTTWESAPRLRGRLLTYLDGATYTLVDLGANARYDAGDTRCALGSRGAWSPGPSAEAATPALVVHATSGGQALAVRRPGAGGFCTGETSTVIYSFATANAYVDLLSASGERVAWVERVQSPLFTSSLRLREPGPNGLLDGVGDVDTTFVTNASWIDQVALAPGILAYRMNGALRVVLPNAATGAFAGETPQVVVPSGVVAIALSSDGKRLAWATASGLTVEGPGPDGVWFTADDELATRALPGGSIASSALSVDGGHLVAIEPGGGQIVHWSAGGNGVFESADGDDYVARMLPSADNRWNPTLGSGPTAGYLVYQVNSPGYLLEQPDVLSVDLTQQRWEVVGVSPSSPIVRTNGSGTLFYGSYTTLQARTSDGRTSAAHAVPWVFDVWGDDLVEAQPGGLHVSGPGPNGLWFDGDDAAPVLLHAGTFGSVWVREGKAAALRLEGGMYVPYVYEPAVGTPAPGTGPVRTATPVLLDPTYGTTESYFQGIAVTGSHAFWTCGTRPSLHLCYRWAGPDGRFGTGDDGAVVTAVMRPSSPATAFNPEFGLRASANRAVVLHNGVGGGACLLGPGPNGVFGDGDDTETVVGPQSDKTLVDLAGDWLALSGAAAVPGEQITILDLARGGSRLLTTTYSSKGYVALEPSGRVFWHDTVLSEGAVFVSAP